MAADGEFRDQADILRQIKDDVFEVLEKCPTDVPAYLREAQFKSEYMRKAEKLEPRGEMPDEVDKLTAQMSNVGI